MVTHKLIFLLWAERGRTRAEVRDILLEQAASALIHQGAIQLAMNIADPEARMIAPAPRLSLERPISAQISVWVLDPSIWRALQDAIERLGFQTACYLVDETLYTDYGDNRHAPPRDWPDGQRSPGVMMVYLLERPDRLSPEAWLRAWHGVMSPVSESIQPRTRYVRNAVVRPLSPDAPRCDAIVEEAWPSKRHVQNPFLFYGADRPWDLPKNLWAILRAVRSCLDIHRIRTTPTSEHLLLTNPRVQRPRRSPYDLDQADAKDTAGRGG